MLPGIELDTRIAELVMKWPRWDMEDDYNGPEGVTIFAVFDEYVGVYLDGSENVTDWFDPSSDMQSAMWVVEEMERRGYWCQMRTPFSEPKGDDGYWVGFTPHGTTGWNGRPDNWTKGSTLPHAICLAALATVNND